MATDLGGEVRVPLTMAAGTIQLSRGSVEMSITLEVRAQEACTTVRAFFPSQDRPEVTARHEFLRVVVSPGELRIDLAGVVTEIERVQAAVDFAVATVSAPGPYR